MTQCVVIVEKGVVSVNVDIGALHVSVIVENGTLSVIVENGAVFVIVENGAVSVNLLEWCSDYSKFTTYHAHVSKSNCYYVLWICFRPTFHPHPQILIIQSCFSALRSPYCGIADALCYLLSFAVDPING